MDFGFGSLVDKSEAYFGKRATQFVLGLVLVSIVVACLSFLWGTAVGPIVKMIEGLARGMNLKDVLSDFAKYASAWMAGGLLLHVFTRLVIWPRFKRLAEAARGDLDLAATYLAEAKSLHEKMLTALAEEQSELDAGGVSKRD